MANSTIPLTLTLDGTVAITQAFICPPALDPGQLDLHLDAYPTPGAFPPKKTLDNI